MEESRSFGYLCPHCKKPVLAQRTRFALSAAAVRIECACEKSELRAETDGLRFRLWVPCGLCGETHQAELSNEAMLDGRGVGLACPKTKQLCCYIGQQAQVEQALKENPAITFICKVFHETSTSMINPVHEVGLLAKKYGKRLFVDCVSAAAGQFIDVVNNNIDICTSVGGKCLGAFPGAAYVCAKEDLLQSVPAEQGKNVYLNLGKHYAMAKKCHQTPNTPNVTLFWALDAALDWTLDRETLAGRIARYQECAKILRDGMKEMGLKFLLPEEQMANTVTSVFLPEGKDVAKFVQDLANDGYTVYPGKGKYLAMNMFQVANMGAIYPDDCRKFLAVLKKHI